MLKFSQKPNKFKKLQIWLEKHQKIMFFLTVFWSSWVLGPILAHHTTKFELNGQFYFSIHPWGAWGSQSSGVICIWKMFQMFFGCWHHLTKKICFLQIEAWCHLYYFTCIESAIITFHDHNFQRNPLFEAMIMKHFNLNQFCDKVTLPTPMTLVKW